jgi:acyl-CoA synthetase (AMP-forming)/AMP-acid ligase II
MSHATDAFFPEYLLRPTSRLLALYPHTSTASTNCAFVPAWLVGATLVIDDVRHFTAERFLANIEKYKVTHATAVPTMLVRILRHVEEAGLVNDVSSLEAIAYGSAPIAPDVTRRLLEFFGPIFMQVYGMTESNGIVCSLRRNEHDPTTPQGVQRLRSCGGAVVGAELEVVDEADVKCAPGVMGELRFRSNYLMLEYWNDTARTLETLKDGWLYSGDLGTMDEDGYLYILDRKKDLIISGGQNIVSKEIEDVLYEHPAVVEAAVIGVPDDEWGERVHAIVSLTDAAVTADDLIAYLASRLASFKRPRAIDILPELPKNPVGKIAKAQLREPFWRDAGRSV